MHNYTCTVDWDVYGGVCMNSRMMKRILGSLVPRPPPVLCFRFAFSIIHGSGNAALLLLCIIIRNTNQRTKTGKAWERG